MEIFSGTYTSRDWGNDQSVLGIFGVKIGVKIHQPGVADSKERTYNPSKDFYSTSVALDVPPMSSQPNSPEQQGKAAKGSVQIKNSNGRLQLVFSYGGRRHYLSPGLADTPINRKAAAFRANVIEEDIFHQRFDPTLEKYRADQKSGAALSTFTPITPIQKPKPSLGELWDRYERFKEPSVSANTMYRDYDRYRSHITKLPSQSLEDSDLAPRHKR